MAVCAGCAPRDTDARRSARVARAAGRGGVDCWVAGGAGGCAVADVCAMPIRPRRARLRAVLARISPMRSIRLASLPICLPPFQYRADIAPLALVLLGGLAKRRLDPVPGVALASVA